MYNVYPVVVLAAGLSRRFEGNKLLYMYEPGKPVVRMTVENALDAGVGPVIVVTGYMRDEVREALRGLRYLEVYNSEYHKGMSSSVKTGVGYVIKEFKEYNGVFITPGDTAWIHPLVYRFLVEKQRETRGLYKIIVTSHMGRRGHPVLFSAEIVPEIMGISEERRGLKELTRKYSRETLVLELMFPGIILDLDTYNDLNRVKYFMKK
ncbi:MAG: nucleotidyltransferase family protein [Crenarchaeota archaeon]|nr:nucleotidyltransferase family protein [Thermoproteota archaeon]